MQNRKRDTEVQNRLLDSVGEGEGGMFWKNSIYIYNCYIFFLNWSFDHYVVSFFALFTAFIWKSILSDMSIATSVHRSTVYNSQDMEAT